MDWVQKMWNIIEEVDIGLCNIVEGMVTNKQFAWSHGVPIGSSVILIDGGRIL